MLVTLTRYSVDAGNEERFSEEQQLFSRLRGTPGFVFRGGGWSSEERATLLAFWKDEASHASAEKSAQKSLARLRKGRVHKRVVTLPWTVTEELHGSAPLVTLALARARTLRADLFQVRAAAVVDFLGQRSAVWSPGLKASAGMLGAVFCKGEGGWSMTLTAWRDAVSHRVFAESRVRDLIDRSRARHHCEEGRHYDIPLVSEWRVRG
ncbi:MAG: heme-degrading monooxygenase HmoA [Myxococcota bacterium]|jgi:heme-degrading monooxygenase HmoA